MMIQRIQSVYLLISTLVAGFFCSAKIAAAGDVAILVQDNIVFLITSILTALLIFISIFLFKNAKKQRRTISVANLLLVAMVITEAVTILSQEVPLKPAIGAAAPIVSFILNLLAINGIKRDEKIIRDSERVR